MNFSTIPKNTSQNLQAGAVVSWEKRSNGISGKTEEAQFNLVIYDEHIIRVHLKREAPDNTNPYSVIHDPKTVDFRINESDGKIILETFKIKVVILQHPFSLQFYDQKGNLLNQDDAAFSTSWLGTEVTNYKKIQPKERFIGLGEKTGGLNRAGRAFTNWNTDYFGYGIYDDPLYISIPFYIGIHEKGTYGIYFDNTHKSYFNFGASNNRFMYFAADDGDMDYYFIHEEKVADIITAYTGLTGRMAMPPKWALGYQQCRYSYYPESEVLTLANTFRDKDMPADVIYLDIHHMEKYKVFTFDGEKFPDPKSMIKKLKEKGFRIVVIMDPGIKTEAAYLPYEEGLEKDLFVKYPDDAIYEGQVWPGWCAFPDFTKEASRKWWAEKMAFYTEAGVDGFWTDMNEPASWGQFTPNLINFDFEGEKVSHRKARNVYGMQMARSAQEGSLLQNPASRPFVLTRAGFAGIQRYAAAWTGDNVASEEHMLAGVRLINSLGLSGVPFSGYDVGGFAGEPTKSLFARWMSLAAFAPFYRAHTMINSNDAEPWAFGEEVEEISRGYMKLRYRMMPMIYSAFYRAAKKGLPVAKSLAIDFSLDRKIYESRFENQYMFCDHLMVAPVESTKLISKVYLPEGNWYYLFNDESFEGGKEIFVETPLNYLPVFVKGGGILTLQSDVAHTQEQHSGVLILHVYKGKGNSETFHYEDDGQSHAYKEGKYCIRKIQLFSEERRLRIGEKKGDYDSDFHTLQLHFHGFDCNRILVNGAEADMSSANVSFLDRLTQFDPLPEYEHPYLFAKNIPTISLPNQISEINIELK